MPVKQAVLASGNRGKLTELGDVLASHRIELLAQSEFQLSEVPETGLTFVENALIKARHATTQTGLPALADDSGLSVDALLGAPGIYSARYAAATDHGKPSDADNIAKLLRELDGVPTERRGARFVCALVWMEHADDPEPLIASASWPGVITDSMAGEGGFGYDPVFYCPASDKTAAQLGTQGKREISHRAQALKLLTAQLHHRYG